MRFITIKPYSDQILIILVAKGTHYLYHTFIIWADLFWNSKLIKNYGWIVLRVQYLLMQILPFSLSEVVPVL